MRRIYLQISEEWLDRLAAIAELERRDVRTQATRILENGIAQLERDCGLAEPHQPPKIIDASMVFDPAELIEHPKYGLFQPMQNGAGVRQDLASAVPS